MTTIRKTDGPPTDPATGKRIIERVVRLSVGTFFSSGNVIYPGDSIPIRNGVNLRLIEADSGRYLVDLDMSITQWLQLTESALSGRTSETCAPCGVLNRSLPGTLLEDEPPPPPEPEYLRLATEAREALNKALSEYEEALTDLEALHSETAGRAAMRQGIQACRTAISRAASDTAYANRILHENVRQCLATMLIDERFSAEERAAAEYGGGSENGEETT